MYVRTLLVILLLILTSGAKAQQQAVAPQSCTMKKVQVERLPDLNIPRSGHRTLLVGNTVYVFGGHTSGFVPTNTAEYYEDGEWHVLQMTYPHDHGLCQLLPTGKVLLAAGHEKSLGVGHTFTVELFDPAKRTFEGYGCMEKKRFFPSSALLADGRVLISVRQSGARGYNYSTNGGLTWGTQGRWECLTANACNGDLLRIAATDRGDSCNILLHSLPNSMSREKVSIFVSYDEGETWQDPVLLFDGPSVYSSLTLLKNGSVGVLLEENPNGACEIWYQNWPREMIVKR